MVSPAWWLQAFTWPLGATKALVPGEPGGRYTAFHDLGLELLPPSIYWSGSAQLKAGNTDPTFPQTSLSQEEHTGQEVC